MSIGSKRHPRLRIANLLSVALALALALTSLSWISSSPEAVAAPGDNVVEMTLPASSFQIRCDGATGYDPLTSGPTGFRDLTSVSGARLTAYNAGELVVLYTAAGNGASTYPPLCAVRYVEGVGAVAEWMFCTDMYSKVCGDIGADGMLREVAGSSSYEVTNPTEVGSNPKLTPDQEAIIAWLILNGHTFDGDGYYLDYGAPFGKADGTTRERWTLQYLVWCVSDYEPWMATSSDDSEREFAKSCEDSLPESRQAEILASIPAVTNAEVNITPDSQTTPVNLVAHMTLTTNLVGHPIMLSPSVAATITLCDPSVDATLSGGALVLGSGAGGSVELCVESDSQVEVTVSAIADVADRSYLSWNQSTPLTGSFDCQVYSTWESHLARVATQARVAVAFDEPVDTGTFNMSKLLVGVQASDFPTDTTFPVTATWSGGSATFDLPANGSSVPFGRNLPEGTVVTLTEGTLPAAPPGFNFVSSALSSSAVTILEDEVEDISWSVTNTYSQTRAITGGFDLQKVLRGAAGESFPSGTVFTVVATVTQGGTAVDHEFTLPVDGTAVTGLRDLPLGTTVSFSEVRVPDLAGYRFTGAVFSPATIEITSSDIISVTATNTYERVNTGGGGGGGGSAGGGGGGGLSNTGADLEITLGVAGLLIALGGALYLGRRSWLRS